MKSTILILACVIVSLSQAAEWIHVDTATKAPIVRTGTIPFEVYADGFDPNVDSPFGPTKETMFLPVVREAVPAYTPVIERLAPYHSLGTNADGESRTYKGKYVDPNWAKGFDVVGVSLTYAQNEKLRMLAGDFEAALAAGYVAGPFTFPYTEEFWQELCTRADMLNKLVVAGDVLASRELTFSDIKGLEVSQNNTDLQSSARAYTIAYLSIFEKEVAARASIRNALTPAEVAAVVWSF